MELTGLPPCVKCCRPVSVKELHRRGCRRYLHPAGRGARYRCLPRGRQDSTLGYLAMVLILSGVALLQYGSRQASVFDR